MNKVEIKWCPTKDMVADFMTKPLQGSHFRRLCDLIMGMTSIKRSKKPTLSGNKGKDGDMLRTSKEKLALYIGTN